MSIDTRDKKMSMIGLAKPFVRIFQDPIGTIDAAAKYMLTFLYSGFTLSPPPHPSPREINDILAELRTFSLQAERIHTLSLNAAAETTINGLLASTS